MAPTFKARDATNVKAVNTANLLNRLHNGHDADSRAKTKRLRHAIHEKYVDVLDAIVAWQGFQQRGDDEGAFEKENQLRMLLSRKRAFTMLLRAMPAVRQNVPSEFLD